MRSYRCRSDLARSFTVPLMTTFVAGVSDGFILVPAVTQVHRYEYWFHKWEALMKTFLLVRANAIVFAVCALCISSGYTADQNGYTAEYECATGGAHCNINVTGLAAQACGQIVETGTAWASINWSNTVICLRA